MTSQWMNKGLIVVLATTLAACGGTKVQRIGVEETRDLSGAWNDTDSRLVSEEMISDALSRPWVSDHVRREGERGETVVPEDTLHI